MRRLPAVLVLGVAVAAALGLALGRGGDRDEPAPRQQPAQAARLAPALARALPRTQFSLGRRLCPRLTGSEGDEIGLTLVEEHARRQLDALVRALDVAAGARVDTVRPDVDGTGRKRERITVRALAETHLAALAPVEGRRYNGCSAQAHERLRRRLLRGEPGPPRAPAPIR